VTSGPSAAARASTRTAGSTLAVVARLVAGQGSAGLPEALQAVAAAVGGDHVLLRAPDTTTVLAEFRRARRPRASGGAGPWVLDIPLRRTAALYGVLTVTSPRPFTDGDATFLAATADVLALLLAGEDSAGGWAAGRAVLDEEADRAQVAATLLDGVGEALVSVRYAAELVGAGRVEPAALDEPVRAALAAVRHAHRDLRAHALEAGLRAALRELADRWGGDRPDDGMSELRLSVHADDPRLDSIAPPVAVTVQRVAEAALRGASGQAVIRASCADQGVKLTVESAEIAYDASELNRWTRRVLALGGDLRLRPDGVELSLPAELRPESSTAQREGRHDDGTDLR
jgi:hypothetical protein